MENSVNHLICIQNKFSKVFIFSITSILSGSVLHHYYLPPSFCNMGICQSHEVLKVKISQYNPNNVNMVAFDTFKNMIYDDRIKIQRYLDLTDDELRLFIAICLVRLPRDPEYISLDTCGIIFYKPRAIYHYVETFKMKKCPNKPIHLFLKKNKYF
eukprot:NODE_287_length_10726_cov_0.240614.p5 type:complete len:156 gc:universal NODE_287_length_10726_cov_0.240614:7707-8174(+)